MSRLLGMIRGLAYLVLAIVAFLAGGVLGFPFGLALLFAVDALLIVALCHTRFHANAVQRKRLHGASIAFAFLLAGVLGGIGGAVGGMIPWVLFNGLLGLLVGWMFAGFGPDPVIKARQEADAARDSLVAGLAQHGIHCRFEALGRIVISRQAGLVWPNQGNSFWVSYAGDHWRLFTWGDVGYRVPESTDMIALCRACMNEDDRAITEVPSHIVKEFEMLELSEDEKDFLRP